MRIVFFHRHYSNRLSGSSFQNLNSSQRLQKQPVNIPILTFAVSMCFPLDFGRGNNGYDDSTHLFVQNQLSQSSKTSLSEPFQYESSSLSTSIKTVQRQTIGCLKLRPIQLMSSMTVDENKGNNDKRNLFFDLTKKQQALRPKLKYVAASIDSWCFFENPRGVVRKESNRERWG